MFANKLEVVRYLNIGLDNFYFACLHKTAVTLLNYRLLIY